MEEQNLANTEKSRERYWKFVLSFWILVSLVFLGWTLTLGEGESNIGMWLILTFPAALFAFLIYCGTALLLKFIFYKIFNKNRRSPILVTVISVVVVFLLINLVPISYISNIGTIPLFNMSINLNNINLEEVLLSYGGFLLVSAIVILVSFTSYLLKITPPEFWKFNLLPAVLTFTVLIFLFPFAVSVLYPRITVIRLK